MDVEGGATGSGARMQLWSDNGSDAQRWRLEPLLTPFESWAAAQEPTGADAESNADPDKDGWPNILEFAVNGNPASGSSAGLCFTKVQPVGGSNAFTYTIAVRAGATFASIGNRQSATVDGLIYTVEACADLATWGTSESVVEVIPALTAGLPAPDAGWEYHTFRTLGVPATTPRGFIRLRIEAQ